MDVQFLVDVIIPILSILLIKVLIPFFKANTTKKEREDLHFWTKLAVEAAEQIYNYRHSGTEKREYVLKFLSKKGVELTESELEVLVEAIVLELNMEKKEIK